MQQVECSSLTGESDLVPALVECKSDVPEHSQCLVFMSTLCMNGEGRGIVVRTGVDKEGCGGHVRCWSRVFGSELILDIKII